MRTHCGGSGTSILNVRESLSIRNVVLALHKDLPRPSGPELQKSPEESSRSLETPESRLLKECTLASQRLRVQMLKDLKSDIRALSDSFQASDRTLSDSFETGNPGPPGDPASWTLPEF